MSEQEVLNWFGGIVAAVWIAFFVQQQRKINQMVSREEFHEEIESAEKTFSMRRETVEQKLAEHDRRFDDMRQDMQTLKRELIDELRHSENRLAQVFRARNDER